MKKIIFLAFFLPLLASAGVLDAPAQTLRPVAAFDCGGTITTGGTAVTAAAADALRSSIVLGNPDPSLLMCIAVVGAATVNGAGNLRCLYPGQTSSVTLAGQVYRGAVSVNGSGSGQRFNCTYYR